MALKSGIQTYQILTNNDEVCISSQSSILLAVLLTLSLENTRIRAALESKLVMGYHSGFCAIHTTNKFFSFFVKKKKLKIEPPNQKK